jgi:hypothetical protein
MRRLEPEPGLAFGCSLILLGTCAKVRSIASEDGAVRIAA